LIIGEPKVAPYPMWYNPVPPFIPIDPNMHSMYYSGIKRLDPLDYGRKEKYPFDITQAKLVPLLE
jgi:hypothetical protein